MAHEITLKDLTSTTHRMTVAASSAENKRLDIVVRNGVVAYEGRQNGTPKFHVRNPAAAVKRYNAIS